MALRQFLSFGSPLANDSQCCLARSRAGAPLPLVQRLPGGVRPMSFYDQWSAIMIASIAGFILVFTALIGAKLLTPYARERAKGVSYECGMLPIGRNWAQVHVRYYIIAILFLIFDVEAVFIFPWAITFVDLSATFGNFVFYEMLVFIGVLFAGLGYAWRRGVLEWKS
jgi:NADH:ubiquinone oxidoreductase subunit 3 (subunit A)